MVTVSDILAFLNDLAPINTKMDFDNVGLLVGDRNKEVKKVLIALDITDEVIKEAAEERVDLIVSHHPLFFDLKAVTNDDICGKKVLGLAKNNISAICMHTNLDVAVGGVNDALAEVLGLSETKPLCPEGVNNNGETYGLGRYGKVDTVSIYEFLEYVKNSLNTNGLRYVDAGKTVSLVAVCGGSGGSELKAAVALGCDTYVTADIKYNTFLDAAELGINLIDAGHFPTEDVIVPRICNLIRERFPETSVSISRVHKQIEEYFVGN